MMSRQLPNFVLFGDSLTEWSFDASDEGLGWYLTHKYQSKLEVLNRGTAFILIHHLISVYTE
jgi:lysophospholipase L1-like esterase